MGIPAAFRWLSKKYPKIISPVIEDQPIVMEGAGTIPVDTTRPNPNGEEFDNLYLDMNGIVHPCSHPEDRPAPADEEEMMLEIFRYTERVVNMVRPRKILMIAVDGVAPRAKMNQQRSRRFRSAQDAKEKEIEKQELLKLMKQQNGGTLPAESLETVVKKAFDSNSITPGTPFMDILAVSLRYWCQYKLNTDPGWAKLKIIISDATVPGEGEHKIMAFVRSQRASPDHDPNTRHVIYGLDADLIMLGLATHEPHFRVLREDVFFQEGRARTCRLCGQKGHEAANCRGEVKEKDGEHDEKDKGVTLKPFIWLHVAVLREYLEAELAVAGLPFRFDLERAIDDWIFMCCFVGNDFLPHLPALEIREHGIDTLTTIWRDNLPAMGGYVTKDGHIDLDRAQVILDGLAKQEDAIFRRRKEQEDRREASIKRRKLYDNGGPRNGRSDRGFNGDEASSTGLSSSTLSSIPKEPSPAITHDMIVNRGAARDANVANKSAASVLKDQLRNNKHASSAPASTTEVSSSSLGKRKASDTDGDAPTTGSDKPSDGNAAQASDEPPPDPVRLWEDGYADRYYQQKFHRDPTDIAFRHQVAQAYVEGLAWVLLYYFQGCPSWEWYYPYHYAPFAADFKDMSKMEINFEKGRISRPFEQLMSVLPAASRHALPEVFHDLMTNEDSEIIDFYPEDFEVDLNGKKMVWQGVALLPFIDMKRLLSAVQSKYPLLSAADTARNGVGRDVLIFSEGHETLYDEVLTKFYSKKQGAPVFTLNPKMSDGLSGKVEKQAEYVPHGTLHYPLERKSMPDVDYDRSVSVNYDMPTTSHTHKSMLLRGVKMPTPALSRSEIEEIRGRTRRTGRSYGGAPLGRFDYNSGRQEPIHYGRNDRRGPPPGRGGRGYGRQDSHYPPHAAAPPPGWVPPPPGGLGFGMGAPPPPPPPAYQQHGHPPYQGGYHNSQPGWSPMAPGSAPNPYQSYGNGSSGTDGHTLQHDDILHITRAALVSLSKSEIEAILDSLVTLLEDLARPYVDVAAHPGHVLLSEVYLAALAADCCSAHWDFVCQDSDGSVSSPPRLTDDALVKRLFDILKNLLDPIPEDYVLPADTLLEQVARRSIPIPRSKDWPSASPSGLFMADAVALDVYQQELDGYAKVLVEYVTASNWSPAFEHFRAALYNTRSGTATPSPSAPESSSPSQGVERATLVILRLLSFFWVDGTKLGLIVQELCSSFLHLRKTYQNTAAIVIPLLITRWIDRCPDEFVKLHQLHKRLDGGADTIFDMCQTMVDSNKRKALLHPMQTALLFLIPDVFEVASNLREAKTGSMMKKITFLDGLRKSVKNGNEQSGYCLVSLLLAARQFDIDSDSALVSYAMDVQDEVQDAFFRQSSQPIHNPPFNQALMTAAFVSLAHLNLDDCIKLAGQCVLPSSPKTFKSAAIQACCHFAKHPRTLEYDGLLTAMTPFMRSQLEAAAALSVDQILSVDIVDMTCSILQFLDSDPRPLVESIARGSEQKTSECLLQPFLLCIISPNKSIRTLAVSVTARLFAGQASHFRSAEVRRRFETEELRRALWSQSSKFLLDMCESVLDTNGDSELSTLHEYLEARLLLLKNFPELSETPSAVPDVVTASYKLESTLLVSLCSVDVKTCRIVTSCIGVFLEECIIVEKHSESAKSSSSIIRNSDIFREIASRDFRFTGLVAFQKRVRTLLRRMQFPTTGILNAWEAAFDRWIHLAKDVSTSTTDSVHDRMLTEWRNYSGFLASLGGICVADQAIILEEPALGGLKWIDRLSSDNYEEPPLTRYLKLSIQLLACSNVKVREAMRDVLSSEVSPILYQPLFRALESELEVLFTGALAPVDKGQDSEIIFADQAASLLRALVERLESRSDLGAASSVHLGALTLNFAKFVDGYVDSISTPRVKIRVCQLCEAVTKRKEHLNLRDDVRIRNQLLEYIFSWVDRPRSPRDQSIGIARQDEAFRVQRDLDKACLRSLAELTFRLPLQPSDNQSDAEMNDMKSQMFHTYFNRFLSLLNHEVDSGRVDSVSGAANRDDTVSSSDLAITILSNLLSANIDVGLKHSLSIGYHGNVEIRIAFVKVLYNILVQGTEFSNITDSAVSERYEDLLTLLTKDLSLTVAMSTMCPSTEVDELTICLLTIFEQRGMIFDFLEALIRQEIEDTENEAEILRRTCVATKMLSVYAKWKGASYLRTTLHKVLERLMLTSQDLDLELDPARVDTPEELQKNALQLQIVAKVFIDDICTSAPNIPASFRRICSIISEAVQPRFPDAKYTAVGAFVFLRFFCPAIVAPDVEGLVSSAPSKEMRRGLLLIAKVIQNLANNVLFGAKEPYMFPLNHFLTQNIYKVTTFLREISVPPAQFDYRASTEHFDFGSCVALHRFLYDHWDHVRQTLLSRERRDYARSPGELIRGRSPVLEPLRNLITNLGPPPLAVSWNRPQISANNPPLYSRFQNFMLRHAFKNTDSFLPGGAVYDGGETKDGLSVICVILRNAETENMDYETLLYCYLRIASRLWHQPFGLFIDATCYNGRNEPQDELFKMIELLTPSEISMNLARIYIYNMNLAFKRCFRRMLRTCTKNERSVFHPKNVDYHLIGSFQDLQGHFHLSQLHLPKETISVVTDTRYMFQPIVRLSKTKGKIEVVIKVGSQFVQITSTKKQEILAGFRLSTTVNDIFRLSEIEEAATSIQTEDDSAFGLRADGGKVVMYFTSPRRSDVLQTIRGAKAKQGKDGRPLKPVERLVRPQDVPGTLLNLALVNLSSPDHILRLSSYNLLGALCKAFKFASAERLICSKDLSVPLGSSRFVVSISTQLATAETQLTLDFLTEFFKPLSLAYMAPWLPGLRTYVLTSELDGEKAREKVALTFRKLLDIAIRDQSLAFILEQAVWPSIVQDEMLLDIFLDELMKTAMSYSIHDETLEIISSVVVSIGTVTLRGKVISRLRKALNRSSLRPTKHLPDNAVWPEICVLLQFCLDLSFDHGVQAQLFLPEVFHIVTMLANTGSQGVRQLVFRFLVNSVHAACTSFNLDDARTIKLRSQLDLLCEPRGELFSPPPAVGRDGASVSTAHDSVSSLSSTENLAALLFDICSLAAPSVDMSNAWRSRWMSLVASTAFQNNPAIQPRAFAVMGYLARDEVDDDLLYQVLVALRNSIGRFGDDSSIEMLVSIISSLSKMMTKLPSASRYGLQLFWLAVSLVRLVPAALFNCTAQFLEAVLINIGSTGEIRGEKMAPLLLQGRSPLDEVALLLDDAYGVHFTADSFHFALCACLARALTDTMTRATAMHVLSSFLEMTTWNSDPGSSNVSSMTHGSPYFSLVLARAVSLEEVKDGLWLAGIGADAATSLQDVQGLQDIQSFKDNELVLICAMELVDFQYLEDAIQTRCLRWLNVLAKARPLVNAATLEAAHALLQTFTSDSRFSMAMNSLQPLNTALEDTGFSGLWRACSLGLVEDIYRDYFNLIEKLIELIII
ncbi:hypothetical protein B0I35DRAFT_451128 [Stachybotrys elegans]|uniref:5'-3' exoribonuclease 2 n=1 Tax=Stachybotrys elegans TaxID=80388 RepID=A0A8K0SWV8_9HYPO|nr:hypothetical protein B0I35DRAFT_451128 [Stachybotrys elegans]